MHGTGESLVDDTIRYDSSNTPVFPRIHSSPLPAEGPQKHEAATCKSASNTTRDDYSVTEAPLGSLRHVKIITIGAGASGINMAFQVKKHMQNVDHIVYEKNESVGGTWFENKYPGCACDIPSHNYQFAWNPNPTWSSFYASHDEILQYLEDCIDRFELKPYIKTRHSVKGAVWNNDEGIWTVTIFDEERQIEFQDTCNFLVDGSGILNNWKWPDIKNLHDFKGALVHSANWPSDLDLKDKVVAVLGTGSSGVQIVPTIQPYVQKLVHFIRSPTWVIPPQIEPKMFSEEQKQAFSADPKLYLQFVKQIEHGINQKFKILINGSKEAAGVKQLARQYMSGVLHDSAKLQDIMLPDFPVGCRRITPAVGYLEALSAPNVQIVTEDISKLAPEGIVIKDGSIIPIDALICATGFDVSFVPRFPLIGTQGNVQDIWRKELPRSYLSITISGCPNYFTILGPNAPIGHGSTLTIIEHASKYILKMIMKAQSESVKSFVPQERAVRDFAEHVDKFMPRTAWSGTCSSWFKNGKTTGPVTALHPGSRIHWFHMLEQPRFEDYHWDYMTSNRFQYLGNGFSTKEEDGVDDTWYIDNPHIL